jgi:hypothetical protein
MWSWKLPITGAIAVSLCVAIPAASGEAPGPVAEQARYLPIQSIGHAFGSKAMSGYFVQRAGKCVVTLMIMEKFDPDELRQASPTRARLVLNPGQIAGVDSEEGRSLNLTCGDDATTLLVDVGDRDVLLARQMRTLEMVAATAP